MPYYHKHCNGKISILRRRCSKCGKKWPISALFRYPLPKDMTKFIVGTKKGPTTYMKWVDKVPLMNVIPRALPNWPRWARVLVVCILIGIVVLITFLIRGLL